jgi:hypothetical protein
MDANPTKGMAPPINSPLSIQEREEFSIDSLLEKVEEFQRRQQLETIDRITMENSWLEYHIAQCWESSSRAMNLLPGIYRAIALLQNTLEGCRREDLAADRAWLAFWGISEERPARDHLASWI